MKKLLIILTVIALMLMAFCSCGCDNEDIVDTGSQGTTPGSGQGGQGDENGADPDNCEHVLETIVGKDATCTENGITDGIKCTKCGTFILSQQTIEAKGHDFSSTITIDSGCRGGDGYTAKICKRCGAIESDFDGEITHPHEFEHYIKEASCTSDGYEDAFKCKNCQKLVYGRYVEKLGHNYEEYTPDGERHYGICTRCEHKGYFNHDCSDYTVVKEPNCYEEGREVGVCEDCDKELERVLPIKHEWDDGEVIEEATCTTYGKVLYTCLICKEEKTTDTGLKAHNYGDFVVTKKPTCTEGGKRVKVCQACGYEYEKAIDALGHLWDTGTITKEPDCYTEGNMRFECGRCDAEKDKALAKKHTFDSVEVIQEPTCTQIGKYLSKCSLCGAEISVDGSIKHDTTYTKESEPTCTKDGNKEYWQCKRCEKYFSDVDTDNLYIEFDGRLYYFNDYLYTYTETTYDKILLEATGHDFSDPRLYYDDKEHYNLCANDCGTKNAREEHIIETEYSLERSGYQDGKYIYYYVVKDVCIICGYEKEEKSRKEFLHEHDAFEILEGIDPTCTQNGLTSGLGCALCDVIEVEQEIIPALGHNFVNSICTRCGLNLMQGTQGLSYRLNSDGTAYIVTGMGTATTPFIVIGSEHKGLPVTGISEYAFSYEYNLISIVIPHTITAIGDKAFYECQKLVEVYNLSSITVAKDTTNGYVGNYALDIYTNILTPSKLVTTNKGYVFYTGQTSYLMGYIGNQTELAFPNMFMGKEYSIYKYAFYDNEKLTSITIGTKTKAIGNYAFSNLVALRSLDFRALSMDDLSNSNYVFDNAGKALGLKVTIGRNVTKIPAYLFCPATNSSNSTRITSLIFEEGSVCKSIGSNAFYECDSIKEVYISDIAGWCNILFADQYSNPLYNGANIYVNEELVTELEIPSTIEEINDFVFSGALITSVKIPNNVILIDKQAFSNCTSLTSVTMSDSVKTIRDSAFRYCTSLTSVKFEQGSVCESIGRYAFSGCTSLTSITIPNSVTSMGSSAFLGCTSLTSATIEGKIGDNAFYDCTSLTNVTIGDSVTSIGYEAFCNCTSLASIIIPDSLESIRTGAFYNCRSLAKIQVGENNSYFQSIDGDLYDKSGTMLILYATGKNEKAFVIPNGVTSIGCDAFYSCTSLTSVTIPNSVTSIGEHAFYGCTSLTSVTIPDSVTLIGISAFSGCYKLVEVYNLSSLDVSSDFDYAKVIHTSLEEKSILETVNDYIFMTWEGKYYLIGYVGSEKELTLPESYNGNNYEIYQYAFYLRDDITSVTIPNSVTSIGKYAFYNCTSLTSVTIPNTVTSIGYEAFYNCTNLYEVYNLSSLNITKDSTSNGYVGYYARVIHIILDSESAFQNINDYIFMTSNGKYYLMGYVGNDTEITLPESYNGNNYEIYQYAFYYRDDITKVTIPNSVTSIGDWAFYNCTSLTSITIPNSVTSIGSSAFSGCFKLVEVYNLSSLSIWLGSSSNGYVGYYARIIHTSLEEESILETVNDYIFMTWEGKHYLIGYVGSDKELTLPESYNGTNYEIYQYAFYNRDDITKVTIPNGVTSIGDSAFYNCTSLTSVNYLGTIEQWCNISFSYLTSNPLYYAHNLYINNELVTELVIPNTVTKINAYAFCGGSFTSIAIPNSVTSIGRNCTSLTSVTIPNSVTSIGKYAFYNCTSLTSVTIGNSVTSIGERAFSVCSKLARVTISDNLAFIGEKAFEGCGLISYNKYGNAYYIGSHTNPYILLVKAKHNYIASCVINEKTKFINHGAFAGCTVLKSIEIPSSVTTIGNYVFSGCTSLTSVTIGNSVTSIGSGAFYNCTSLTSVTFENTSGWYVTKTQGATSGTNVDLTNIEDNAIRLKNTYYNYYWYRAEN